MGFIDFTTGQVLTADQMDLVMRQSVMRFADAATRDTALAEVLAEGMVCYLDDTNEVLKYDGTDWVDVNDNDDSIQKSVLAAAGDIIVATAAGTPSALTIGTAGQILESNGTALSYVTPDSSPDDIITTQGDLIIGNVSGDAVRLPLGAADTVLTSDGTTVSFAAAGGGGGFDTITEVTASNSSFDVSGISGFARITLIGGGGGGGGNGAAGSSGGSTSVTISATTTTATGGAGGGIFLTASPSYAFGSFNGGSGRHDGVDSDGADGNGGEIKIIYEDLSLVSTIDVIVGAGGAGVRSGFRGVVLLESAS